MIPTPSPAPLLAVSICLYQPNLPLLAQTLASLAAAVDHAVAAGHISGAMVGLVDNSEIPMSSAMVEALPTSPHIQMELLCGLGNIGYGRANNLFLLRGGSEFSLVLNPDVELMPDALTAGFKVMQQHPRIGLLAPAVLDANDRPTTLCKRYPSVLDLALRGFAPAWLARLFRRRLARYSLADSAGIALYPNPPIISGCCMLFRTTFFRELGGFDPRFFLYFEDFDLSWQASRRSRSAYCAHMKIRHAGGQAARKGWHHIELFVRSGVLFFNKHGWKLF